MGKKAEEVNFWLYSTEVGGLVAAGAKEIVKNWETMEYMQDMTSEICTNAEVGSTATLIDSRDNNVYTIAKIKNRTDTTARCWMVQNLRLSTHKALTLADSDVVTDFTLPISALNGFTADDQLQPKMYYNGNTEYGAYYNWYTATAGTTITSNNANGSICPKGWRLPTSATNGEMHQLVDGLQISNLISIPYNFVYTGYAYNSQLNGVSSHGFYWTSSIFSSDNASALDINNQNAPIAVSTSRYYGASVRCVAR